MRYGHRQAQDEFIDAGKRLGYRTRRSYSTSRPTDGVWLQGDRDALLRFELPVVALEVAVSEGPKSIRGSIGTLESVSPALGVLLIHDDEIFRRLLALGYDQRMVLSQIDRLHAIAVEEAAMARQRIQVWRSAEFRRWLSCIRNAPKAWLA